MGKHPDALKKLGISLIEDYKSSDIQDAFHGYDFKYAMSNLMDAGLFIYYFDNKGDSNVYAQLLF